MSEAKKMMPVSDAKVFMFAIFFWGLCVGIYLGVLVERTLITSSFIVTGESK